ncbi:MULTISPECIES: phosphotransferase [Paenibacillus]|uniref:phosphotransferase n=1 Tax=Paenibacillus TaxID=44249 RepID=UPI0022B898BD|nr:phosphotransferase [Paenibacillus caseinilyticus]MCZ8518356.1 phosphotransferase [Paenibacillus caseinilyticus]
MAALWSAQHVASEEEARRLIERQFPELRPVRLARAGEGFDNTVYLVNGSYIFRFPRREISAELIRLERRLLPWLLEEELPLSIPEPLYYGTPGDAYPWPFLGYRLVEGSCPGPLTREQRMRSAEPLAAFFRKLHALPSGRARELGVPADELRRLDVPWRKPALLGNIRKLAESGLWHDERLHAYAEALQSPRPEPGGTTVLVHGDPHIRNIIVGPTGTLSGVIDWGDAHLGHPAVDLSLVYSFLPPEGRQRFYSVYGPVDPHTEILARFRTVFTHVTLLLYAQDTGDPRLIRAASDSLSLALS